MELLANINCIKCKARLQSIFKELSHDDLCTLQEMKSFHQLKKGESLFREGSYPRGLFCLNEGKIKISQVGVDGKEQIVHLVHEGDVMGYRAIFGEDTYSCSAVASDEAKVCFLPKSQFYKMAEKNSKLMMRIAHLLADELKQAERKITITAQQPVLDRIAQCLLFLKKNYGVEADGTTINCIMKREELANMAGTTRESATRMLYKLQNLNLIRLSGKKVKLVDEKRLTEIAQQP